MTNAMPKYYIAFKAFTLSTNGGSLYHLTSHCFCSVLLFFYTFLPECPGQTDIAFLLDGSGSVNKFDFEKMKDFVKDLIREFLERDTKVRTTFTCYYRKKAKRCTVLIAFIGDYSKYHW